MTVAPLVVMLPVTAVLALFRKVKVDAVTVSGSTGSLKTAVRAEDVAVFVALLTGVVALTVGRVVSGAAPVVKVQLKGASKALPARSLTPVVRVTVYIVEGASDADGVNIAVSPVTENVPLTAGEITRVEGVMVGV